MKVAVLGEIEAGEEAVLDIEVEGGADNLQLKRAALLRTARRLFEGNVLIPREVWDGRSGKA